MHVRSYLTRLSAILALSLALFPALAHAAPPTCIVSTDDWMVKENGDGYLDACVALVEEHPEARLWNYADAMSLPALDDPFWDDLTELVVDRGPDGLITREVFGRHGANQSALRVAGLLP
jgi:hypothetical protein